MFTKLSEHFEFRHFRPHYLDVDTIFGDLGVNVSSEIPYLEKLRLP